MTLADVEAQLAEIKRLGIDERDDEYAHAKEDDLWHDVLEAIAAGAENPAGLATTALRSRAIKFSRWFA